MERSGDLQWDDARTGGRVLRQLGQRIQGSGDHDLAAAVVVGGGEAELVEAGEQFATTLTTADPTLRLWTNKDGSEVTEGAEFLRLLVGQVSSPVRWDLDMKAFEEAGVTGLIEVAPAGALAGLAKRGLKGVPTVAIKTPDDLPAAFDLIDQAA